MRRGQEQQRKGNKKNMDMPLFLLLSFSVRTGLDQGSLSFSLLNYPRFPHNVASES